MLSCCFASKAVLAEIKDWNGDFQNQNGCRPTSQAKDPVLAEHSYGRPKLSGARQRDHTSTWDVLHFSIRTRKRSPQQQPTEDESKNKGTVHTRRVEAAPLKCLLMLMHCNETQHNLLHEIPKVNKNQEHKLISPQRSRTPTAFSLPYHISFFFLMSSAKLPSNTFMNSSPQWRLDDKIN